MNLADLKRKMVDVETSNLDELPVLSAYEVNKRITAAPPLAIVMPKYKRMVGGHLGGVEL